MESLAERYQRLCSTPGDIQEHLPNLYELACQCRHVTELGVRTGVSTTALLHAQPNVLVSIDIAHCPVVAELSPLAGETDFRFVQADSLTMDIESTDMLFIDTYHTYEQLQAELARHAAKVRCWIVLHDTTIFGEQGEDGRRGLWPAVQDYVAKGTFRVRQRLTNQNGLTILERAQADTGSFPGGQPSALHSGNRLPRHKDFRQDLVAIANRLVRRHPFALTRFGDGEMKILFNESVNVEFQYRASDPEVSFFRDRLAESLRHHDPDYLVGIACPCCVGVDQFERLRSLACLPEDHLTWANIFVNSNYSYFRENLLPVFGQYPVFLVCNQQASLDRLPFKPMHCWRVQNNAWIDNYGLIESIARETQDVNGALFLFCAGPMANLLAHQLFQANPCNTYLNIGSTLDPLFFGDAGFTRGYLSGGATICKTCTWLPVRSELASDSRHGVGEPAIGRPRAKATRESAIATKRETHAEICQNQGNSTFIRIASRELSPQHCGITVVLTVYRRPHLLAPQLAAIRSQSVQPDAIWIWANEPDEEMTSALKLSSVDRIVTSDVNAHFHARFALAQTAPTEFVALFDDDTIPGGHWFANCLETMHRRPGILGTAGCRLRGPFYAGRTVHGWHVPSADPIEVDIVGHGWFLRKQWLKYLFAESATNAINGEDIELCARSFRLAGIRAFCPSHPPDDRSRWGSLHGAELGTDDVAASVRPNHLSDRDKICQAEIAAGWLPLYLRGAAAFTELPAIEQDDGYLHTSRDESTRPELARSNSHVQIGAFQQQAAATLSLGKSTPASFMAYLRLEPADDFEECAQLPADADEILVKRSGECRSPLAGGPYKCVVCGTTFERVFQPARLLNDLRSRLAPRSRLLASFRNRRQYVRIDRLLSGGPEEPLADNEIALPICHFTRRDIEKLFYRAGFRVAALERDPTDGWSGWNNGGRPTGLRLGPIDVVGLPPDDAEDFFTANFLVEAELEDLPSFGLTSIVLITHNQLDYTHWCIESIRTRTDELYELIVVDNGSTDGTVEYLRACDDVTLIENADNRGFPAAVNQGILASKGEFILLLNNDTVVTTGWLRRMLETMRTDTQIGVVGPVSNHVSGEQQVPVSYSNLNSLDGFAWDWGKSHQREQQDTDRIVGFCMLIRRAVIDAVGVLDERFGIGNFEDDDFTFRACRAGYRAVIVRDAFVHHFGERTFKASSVDFTELLETNRRVFADKWHDESRIESEPSETSATQGRMAHEQGLRLAISADGTLALANPDINVSLCMIVRDNEKTLGACLTSIKPWVDEIVVVDTGSTDRTPQIAREHEARVVDFPWPDSFALARNESLRHARGHWVFWMDSDDTISPDSGRKLRDLALQPVSGQVFGYTMQVHCPAEQPDCVGDVTIVDHVKMFRNRPDLRFEGRIHEQIMPAIRRAGGTVLWTDIAVVHSGADHSEEGQKRKQQRDLRLLRMEAADRPDNSFVLFNIGMTLADIRDHDAAQGYLRRSVEVAEPSESHLRKAYALLVASHTQLDQFEEANHACRAGRMLFPQDVELLFREGFIAQHYREFDRSVRAYRQAIDVKEDLHFGSVDRGLKGYKTRHNLALVYEEVGRLAEAEQQWRLALAEVPEYRIGWRGLINNLLRQQRIDLLEAELARVANDADFTIDVCRAHAQVAQATGDIKAALSELETGMANHPSDRSLLEDVCRLLFEFGDPADTEARLRQLIALEPSDASAWHNLGTTYLRLRRSQPAVNAFQTAARLRPDSAASHFYLGLVLEDIGDRESANSEWIKATEVDPHCPEAHEAHRRLQANLLISAGRRDQHLDDTD